MKIIHLICAARPNFMKIAPLYHALKQQSWCQPIIIHTGQHYDYHMSQTFFEDFDLPIPHFHLEVGSGSHAEQTAQTMMKYERLCLHQSRPDFVVVVGDVNATMACTIAAKKMHLPVAHLEAGLRSFDRSMPEEINRLVTDSISDYYWTPSSDADDHLRREGIADHLIRCVGNIMIDTFVMMHSKIAAAYSFQQFDVHPKAYGVLTLHRPVNVDNRQTFQSIIDKIAQIHIPIIFPVHPRTQKILDQLPSLPKNLLLTTPLGYVDFMSIVLNSKWVISDSGGVQEETTYLRIPCFTLRDTTERPITVTQGSNQLVTIETLLTQLQYPKQGSIPLLWDGQTATRIVQHLQEIIH